jgi:integrase
MKRAWVYQDHKQIQKHGPKGAGWYVGWYDPEGKRRCQSCGPGALGKSSAGKLRKKIEAELLEGTYRRSNDKKSWDEFRAEYETRIVAGQSPSTRRQALNALRQFERIIHPLKVAAVKTQSIDTYRARRRIEPGKKPGSIISRATVNKELRHLRAALKKAFKWGYLPAAPDFEFEKEAKKLPVYVSPEHFGKIYQACEHAKLPTDIPPPPYSAADWWRGLIVMAYMTGWRISELLGLRRDDLDLIKGEAITRADSNKGKRDETVKLHPVVVQHLKKLAGFTPTVFPWYRNMRGLMEAFAKIQEAAGVHLPCHGDHKHSRYCHVYGFHDLRRAFATMNADRLTADALQALMRHKSYQTTQRYINMARQLDSAVESLHVPEILKTKKKA